MERKEDMVNIDMTSIANEREKRVAKSISVLPSVWDEFKVIAEESNISTSRLIENFLVKYVEEINKKK